MKKHLMTTLSILLSITALADEGMWTFDQLPLKAIEQKYGVKLSADWIEHVRLSTLRVSLGGSASFVSAEGLVMTNHHVGAKAIYNLSTEKKNLMEEGFYAASLEDELPCPNMHVDQLVEIRDVTKEVNDALNAKMSSADQEQARKKTLAVLKDKAQKETGLHVEDVTLFQGAKYHLYFYKRYTDIRLVMAPEKAIAFFGGDIENFEYPRYDLDVCFFRVYEEGKPLSTKDFLSWSGAGPFPGEPLFVIGNPGSTKRLYTAAHLRFLRDTALPTFLSCLQEKIDQLDEYSAESPENERQASQYLSSLRNSQKALQEEQVALQTQSIIMDKQKSEDDFLKTLSQQQQKPWVDLNQALEVLKSYYTSYFYTEKFGFRFCREYVYAKDLVRYAVERQKPNEKRLKEYQDSELDSLQRQLFSTEPLYPSLEEFMLTQSLQDLAQQLGSANPLVKAILLGKSPQERASAILKTTKMGSLEYRKQLFQNPALIEKSDDPMIVLAREIDPYAREMRLKYEDQFDSVQKTSYAAIVNLYFTKYGDSLYPDATFTPRLSYGVMKGYFEKGAYIDPITHYKGLYEENRTHDNKPPYQLPERWLSLAAAIDENTPLNLVSTNDIIGGNSGSPLINQKGEIVGLIFDGNEQSQVWDLQYSDTSARAVSVHSTGILYALERVYHAERVLQEIERSKR